MFQPLVTAGGGTVTFSMQGVPTWLSFDTDTGALTGKPTATNVGTTGNLMITGSNGSSSASIGPFQITVKAAAPITGSATLSWVAPTQNTDGTPITDLAGYHIYYGGSQTSLSTTINISSATTTTYTVNGLNPGTYFFAVAAYNSEGLDSTQSNVGSKTI